MLSRLKGIETLVLVVVGSSSSVALDMLSRLKGIETLTRSQRLQRPPRPLDMLSRLKGIETHLRALLQVLAEPFGYAFPFEGN